MSANEHRFYGSNRAAGKGGFDIDESKLHPDSNYWQSGANGAKAALERILGEDETLLRLSPLWNSSRTWKDICIDTESVLDEARKLQTPITCPVCKNGTLLSFAGTSGRVCDQCGASISWTELQILIKTETA